MLTCMNPESCTESHAGKCIPGSHLKSVSKLLFRSSEMLGLNRRMVIRNSCFIISDPKVAHFYMMQRPVPPAFCGMPVPPRHSKDSGLMADPSSTFIPPLQIPMLVQLKLFGHTQVSKWFLA